MTRRARTIDRILTVNADGLTSLLAARHDVLVETPDGGGTFQQDEGPFTHYRRTVTVLDGPAGASLPRQAATDTGTGETTTATLAGATVAVPDGTYRVRQTIEYRLPPGGVWAAIIAAFLSHALRRLPEDGKTPVWAPPRPMDARALRVLMLLATLALILGYHGTLLGQTMTFAADEFGASESTQGDILALARAGSPLAIVLGALADRTGRRRMMILSLLGCIGATALGAATPSLAGLAVTQAINRGAWAAGIALLGVIVAEEMPATGRAHALGLLTMCGAIGAGLALAVLPVADVGTEAWRLLYALPLLMVPAVLHFGRQLPESKRYERPHRNLSMSGHFQVLLMVCLAAFLLNLLLGPAPQFRNEFLRDERDFSALALSLFAALTALPGALGIVIGGRLAETRGRRMVVAVSATLGGALVTLSFITGGIAMWGAATLGTIGLAAVAPSFTIYYAELFPTSLRGRASGIISMVAMGGSVVGLLVVGRLAERFGTFGPAMAIAAAGPCLMALVVLGRFPETMSRELEELNPEDALERAT